MSKVVEAHARDEEAGTVIDHPGLRIVLEHLENVKPERSANPGFRNLWSALCPAHGDRNSSLSIGWNRNGRIMIHCHAGCTRGRILRALGVDARAVAPPKSASSLTCYDYRDENGTLLFQVTRRAPKVIRNRRPDGRGGWVNNRHGVRLVPYRLPEVIAGIARRDTVFICEGEKDADRLATLGLCSTCNPGGAGKWRSEYSEMFAGADVVVLQDNDDAGKQHAHIVAKALNNVAASVRMLLLPGLPPKGDVSDWLDAGHTLDQLLEHVSEAAVTSVNEITGGSAHALGDDAELQKYFENEHGLWRIRGSDRTPLRLTNFTARIARQVVEDDGAEQKMALEISVTRSGRQRTLIITAAEFGEMKWPGDKVDARAAITPFTSPREVGYVIRLLSSQMTEAVVYTHTGWRQLADGTHVYLHGAGAIGPSGAVYGVHVRLEGPLLPMALPEPPIGDKLRTAIRATLGLLQVAPRRVMLPLLAAAFRAPLGQAGFSIHLFGPTGIGKTQLAALVQQFFGASFDAQHLPTNWTSTPNAIEGLLFQAKDMPVVVDDFNPRGAHTDVQRLHQVADRVFRAVANVAARGRMRSDTTLRPPKPPRAFLISTGEEAPIGHSLAARILLIEVAEGDVDFGEALSEAQERARAGDFAGCMSAFLQYHASSYAEFASRQPSMLATFRDRAGKEGYHRRSPDATANGMLGWIRFLDFALFAGAIEARDRDALEARGWQAFQELAGLQTIYQAQENQARLFVALIGEAVQGGLGHLSTFGGDAPRDAASCGWRRELLRDDEVFRPLGPRIGYVDDDYAYLIPHTAYRLAQDTARGGTHSLSLTVQTLAKRLIAEGLLSAGETRGHKNYSTQRKTRADGKRVALWRFSRSVFGFTPEEPPDHAAESFEM
jgi:hypothetical protein